MKKYSLGIDKLDSVINSAVVNYSECSPNYILKLNISGTLFSYEFLSRKDARLWLSYVSFNSSPEAHRLQLVTFWIGDEFSVPKATLISTSNHSQLEAHFSHEKFLLAIS